tara:strand:- start:707 stop:3430 length:2724 start_codon:yes stop_codon:yes gene_type:complete
VVNDNFIYSIITDRDRATTSSADLAIPSIKIPIRLVGNEDSVFNDEQWKAIVFGGSYGTSSYVGVYTPTAYSELNFTYETPYDPIFLKQVDPTNVANYTYADFSYDYNSYLKEYQDAIMSLGYLSIPNYYFILSHQTGLKDGESSVINEHVSLGESVSTTNLLGPVSTVYPPTYDIDSADIDPSETALYIDKRQNYEHYLNNSFATASSDILEGTAAGMMCMNLMFNKKSQENLFLESLSYEDVIPYSVKLKLPFKEGSSTTFFDMIESSGYENLLLLNIKYNFVDITGSLKTTDYTRFTTAVESSDTAPVVEKTNMKTSRMNYVDFYGTILRTIIQAPNPKMPNFYIMGSQAIEREELINDHGIYRYKNSIPAFNLLERINSYIETDGVFSGDIEELEDFMNIAETSRLSETLAYRVEKKSITNPEDIQNFYISKTQTSLRSTANRDGFTIYDTQVKYGETYSYSAYAYVLVYGYAYKYSDLVLTKQIANKDVYEEVLARMEWAGLTAGVDLTVFGMGETASEISSYVPGGAYADPTTPFLNTAHCLQFYNPTSGETAERLVYNDGTLFLSEGMEIPGEEEASDSSFPWWASSGESDEDSAVEWDYLTWDSAASNAFFTNAQLASYYKFLADFNISIEPTLRLIEVPLYKKNITVLDHPPNSLDISPFQRMDNSQIIGFLSNVENFVPTTLPLALTVLDREYQEFYLESNNLIVTDTVSFPSRSKVSAIEVYRKDTKPKSILDFDNSDLVTAKPLYIPGSDYCLSNCIYEEKIPINKKYYYILRTRNENGVTGHAEAVIETEIVDDGGYKYALFTELFEDDFEENIPKQVTKGLKKIFQVVPNIAQYELDDSNVDYSNTASEEVANLIIGTKEDSIFNKTFKIRLTSKKTGKKIDLNVTYKIKDMY